MKTKQILFPALLSLLILNSVPSTAQAQGTAFTYQGQLQNNGLPANGNYDFTFALFNNSSTNAGQVGVTQTNLDLGVTNGLFTVVLNFGGVFTGTNYWLAISVRTNGGNSFNALNPLQELTPTPYAIYTPNAGSAATATSAGSANSAGTAVIFSGNLTGNVTGTQGATVVSSVGSASLPAAQLTGSVPLARLPGAVVTNSESGVTLNGTFSGNGSGLTSLSAANLAGALPAISGANLTAVPSTVALLGANQSFTGQNSFTGSVGIGTTSPTKGSLEIDTASGSQPGYNPVGILVTNGANNGSVGAGGDVSIWAAGWIFAETYIAFSDARIKNIQGQSDSAADLKTLLGIKVTDYTYKDTIAKGNRPRKKVIAQQVEQVYPQAVSQSTDVIPDIYKKAMIEGGWVQLATDLKVGDRVKLIGEKEQGVHKVLEVRDGAFRTDFKPATDKVFVYGREVKDFRSVDYEAISMLNVSATQELARKVETLQARLGQAQAEREALLKYMAALEAHDQAREERLSRIESALERSSAQVKYTSLSLH